MEPSVPEPTARPDPQTPASVKRPTNVRFVVLGALFLLAVVTYLDRVCISLAAPWITIDLHLSHFEMGMVFSIFAAAYALFEVPTGWLGDRFGQRSAITRILVWWSAFTALTGTVQRFWTLLTVRFLFGAGEAGAYPNMTRAVANWFSSERRGSAMGVIWMGSRLGAAMTPPVVLFLIGRVGWRETFWMLGILGIFLAVLWFWWYRDAPWQKTQVNAEELELIRKGEDTKINRRFAPISWKSVLTDRNLWSIDLMYFTLGFTYYLYISWFPTYLLKARNVRLSELGLYASLPLAISAVTTLAGGLITDRLVRRWGVRLGRRGMGVVGCGASAVALIVGLQLSDSHAAILLISLAAGGCDLTLASCWSTCADVGGPFAGTISGMMNMIGNVGSVLSPLLMGLFVETLRSWNLTFYVAACLNLIGMLLWFKIDATRKIEWES